jgi:hypothetical protein
MTLPRVIRHTAMVLILALLGNSPVFAAGEPVDAAAMKAKVAAHGVGQGVRVTLSDDTEARGLIVSIGEQSFALKPKGADQAREIQYTQITGVHNQKLSTRTKVIIVVAIFGAAVGITDAVLDAEFHNSLKNL